MGKAMNNLGVVIPAWNRGSVITEALDSVLNQTRPPLQERGQPMNFRI
jgi:glycosyltransferase involved in cell wall biosynthesis